MASPIFKDLSNRNFIRPSEIQAVYGVSRASAYRWMAEGKFPKLVSLSERCKGWKKSELDKHFGLTD
jgi:predicted DNA-binding transcriptional regulator AlpA